MNILRKNHCKKFMHAYHLLDTEKIEAFRSNILRIFFSNQLCRLIITWRLKRWRWQTEFPCARKWLPPFRKLSSQGKLEKSQSMGKQNQNLNNKLFSQTFTNNVTIPKGGHDTRNLQKQISKSKFKVRI